MLFEKIRRTQKPVFIMLGVVFALSFTLLGVGSGVGGLSLGNLLNQNSSGGSSSISDLLGKVQTNPKDAVSWLALARAYEANNQVDPSLGAYQQFLGLRPKNGNVLSEAATLYETRGQSLAQQAQYYQSLASQYQSTTSGLPTSASKLSTLLTTPLVTQAQQPLQTQANAYQQQAVGDIKQAMSLWQRDAVINPTDPTIQRAILRDAYATQDYATAYKAVEQVLKLEPTAPDKKQLQAAAKQLKAFASINSSTTPTTTTP
jgi:cytochrome c-type biogenesis protein CcmH/NrfG